MKTPLLQFTEKGIYCQQANVYLDPWKKVDNALITHGHADHSRWGHKKYITQHDNVPIIKHRLGAIEATGVNYNEKIIINNVTFSFHPAGHIPGSSQIRVAHKGDVWVFTGDYKLHPDGLSVPYEPVKCNSFITECTFGLPAFKWRPQQEVFNDINEWWKTNKAEGKTSVLFGYSLGKAQRLIKNLDTSIGTIYTHAAVENLNEVIRPHFSLPDTVRITADTDKKAIAGNIIIAPPSAHGTPWLRRFAPFVTATASGWMAFRGARRRRAVDRGFVLSDHCDWNELLTAIKETGCEKVITTHGYTDVFSKYLQTLGYDARTEQTQYEGENAETNEENEVTS
ncbi:ligase-associated DNA damage response exonuclease [Neptunitalea lumnitzerae]|uniref:DNA ligase-associated DEXH box helicase n=1 Tax=Neptunitalea lumnitzerae TaxID=2965509 RepID=A0ABQ5MG41_9FLAO|nr:ligase-associated DNA damage response exonuclease [Neptunitalea sp. Y10]GLB48375.1 DNA ligase-associated DEXH box helicase [Neptunitalea sp. Y10]